MVLSNCATRGLEPYVPTAEQPWNGERVQHLVRRTGFGAKPEEIQQGLTLSPAAAVETVLRDAANRSARPAPEWAGMDYEQMMARGIDPFGAFISLYYDWFQDALTYGPREKMSLFWQNHFVAIYESHSCPSYHYDYVALIERMAFGNFRELTREITKTPAMLFFLNGFQNNRFQPNENYARELFELFTLGEGNGYTQQDIVEASRALTGFNGWTTYCGGVEWSDWGFDNSDKTIFGVTANFNADTLIDLLFAERAEMISRFVCRKLYRFFVNPVADETIVNGLAETLRNADWEIGPVLLQLFSSAHFFDDANVGVLLKSPLEMVVSLLRQGDYPDFEDRNPWGIWAAANMGQYVGHPPDVAGWKGDRTWIDSNRLTLRWEFTDGMNWTVWDRSPATMLGLARTLSGDSNSPEVIANAIIDYFIPRGLLSDEAYLVATDVLKWEVPENYYTDGIWSLNYESAALQVTLLMLHLGRLPEFQLT